MRIKPRGVVLLLGIALCFVIFLRLVTTPKTETKTNTAYEAAPTTPVIEVEAEQVSPPVESEPPEEEEWPYPITQEEIDLIALVTMAEAEGETELGKRLVIDTILNRVDDPHFPDTVYDVIYYPNAFSSMWNGRVDRCYVMPEIVELVKEELLDRTNYECVFFTAGNYSQYGVPMFQECCHYFSSYD